MKYSLLIFNSSKNNLKTQAPIMKKAKPNLNFRLFFYELNR